MSSLESLPGLDKTAGLVDHAVGLVDHAARLVDQFERGTLPKEQWTHTAHFVMALWYCVHHPLPVAVHKIRDGIKTYNVATGGQNTDTSGYHETITLFYTGQVARYLVIAGITTLTDEHLADFLRQPFLEKQYMLRFYSRERLMSREARRGWVAPDAGNEHLPG
jgi:hypothetical protein